MPQIELFAEVALLRDDPAHSLARGQVGTVVEMLSGDAVEVEFIDNDGHTYATAALHAADLVRLHHGPLERVA